jgi:hypothetical protein
VGIAADMISVGAAKEAWSMSPSSVEAVLKRALSGKTLGEKPVELLTLVPPAYLEDLIMRGGYASQLVSSKMFNRR